MATELEFTEVSAATATALGCTTIDVTATENCYVTIGETPVATSSNIYLPADTERRLVFYPECKVAAIAHDTWTPAEIDNKLLWLRAADLVGTVDDGAEVLTWSDKSGNGFDATGSAGTAPTLDVDGFNGRPTLAFDGTEFLTTADLDYLGEFTIFFVANRSTAAGPVLGDNSDSFPKAYIYENSKSQFTVFVKNDSDYTLYYIVTTDSTADQIYSVTMTDASRAAITINGDTQSVAGSVDYYDASNSINTISTLDIGKIGAGYLTGDISEILITNSALSDADREKVEGYLAHDYGLESELPEDHTWLDNAPMINGTLSYEIVTGLITDITYGKMQAPPKQNKKCSNVFKPDTNTVLAFSETSAATSAALGCQAIEVVATNPCCIEFGASPTATTSSMYLPAGRPERFMVEPECKVAAIAHNAWTPAEIDNKLLWLRAADLVGTVDDGAEVLTWSDKSGNGFDATGTEGSAPTLDVDGFNGRPTLSFDGTEWLTTAYLGASGDLTMFVVSNSTYDGGDTYNYTVAITNPYSTFGYWASVLVYRIKINMNNMVQKNGDYRSDNIMSSVFDGGSSLKLYRNGGLLGIDSSVDASADYGVCMIGHLPAITDSKHIGDISEIIIFNSALSDADREKVEGYLAHDYGLESELPEDHTYATVQPLFGGNIHIKKLTEVGASY